MREPSPSRSSLKRIVCLETALYSFTGTFSSPKLIEPLHIALGIWHHEFRLVKGDQLIAGSTSARLPLAALRQSGASLRASALADDLTRVLVVAHALEGRLAQGALLGEFGPRDLAEELRLTPPRQLRLRAPGPPDVERAVGALALGQLLRQEVEIGLLQA